MSLNIDSESKVLASSLHFITQCHTPEAQDMAHKQTLAAVWKLFTLFPSSLPSSGSLLGPAHENVMLRRELRLH